MYRNGISLVIGFILCAILLHFCEGRDVIEKTSVKTKVVKVTDTLKIKGDLQTKYKKVYIRKTDTSIVYVDRPDSTTVEARKYSQNIEGKRMKGVVHVTTTGELLDLCAEIETQDSIIEKTTIKYKDRSRLFLSGQYNTNASAQIGLDWNLKNKVLLKGGVGYQINTNTPYISLGVGIPLF